MVVRGQESAAARSKREVCEEERVIADQDLPMLHAPPCRLIEALLVGWAATPHAVSRVTLRMLPHRSTRQDRQRCLRAIGCRVRPIFELMQRMKIIFIREQLRLPFARDFQSTQRHIVAAPFHEHRRELFWNNRVEQRNVLLHQLLLQRNRVGANDNALAMTHDARDRWKQIRETLSDARACFDEQPSTRLHTRRNCTRHFLLLRSNFKSLKPTGEWTFRAEKLRKVFNQRSVDRTLQLLQLGANTRKDMRSLATKNLLSSRASIVVESDRWTGGRAAEGVGLLNRYRSYYSYRGFESRPVRFLFSVAVPCASTAYRLGRKRRPSI